MIEPLRILHVTSEVAPFAKTGGLGDVCGALPAAQRGLGLWTAVVAPCYRQVPRDLWVETGIRFPVRVGRRVTMVDVRRGELSGGVPVYLVHAPEAFDRPGLYGPRAGEDFADNAWRFGLLAEAALVMSRRLRLHPDVMHCHDWQAGLVPLHCHERLGRLIRTVFTVHNLGYHGSFSRDAMDELGLDPTLFHPEGIEFWGWMSFLKAGLVYADKLTTVSPAYAAEVQTAEHGHGLDGMLRARQKDLVGILNGVDYADRDPRVDRWIPTQFDAEDLAGKAACRTALERALRIESGTTPLFGIVSRLAPQKGMDLVPEAVAGLVDAGKMRLAILGQGDPTIEAVLPTLEKRWPGKVGVRIAYDENLSRLIIAGADAMLVPSRYEPCGLTQLYALRYGTLPIVRLTGGLRDTVQDGRTGFAFQEPEPKALAVAIERAIATFQDPARWREMQRAAMGEDFSWTRSAVRYAELYDEVHQRE